MEKLNRFYLGEEVDSGFPFSHLFIEDIFKGPGPCSIEFKSINFMVKFLLSFQVFMGELGSE